MPGLVDLLRRIRAREVRVDQVETRVASPFARSLVFAYMAAYLYQGDSPAAERRAQALAARSQHAARAARPGAAARPARRARARRGRGRAAGTRRGDARRAPRRARRSAAPRRRSHARRDRAALRGRSRRRGSRELAARRRIVALRIAGESRWIAAEDAALYRDALGCVPPVGPRRGAARSRSRSRSNSCCCATRARTRRSPAAQLAQRFGLLPAQAEARARRGSKRAGACSRGEFRPGGREREWCDADVLRRIRRRTMAKLRGEVAPVEARVLARFLPAWHGDRRRTRRRAPARRGARAARRRAAAVLGSRAHDPAGARARLRPAHARRARRAREAGVGRLRRARRARRPRRAVSPRARGPADRARRSSRRARRAAPRDARSPRAPRRFVLRRAARDRRRRRASARSSMRSGISSGRGSSPTTPSRRCARSRRAPRSDGPARTRRRPRRVAGRWSRSSSRGPVDATRRAHARALVLLDRWGVVARDALAAESIAGGFSAVYPVLRAMEEAGKIRRGHFVDGLGGAQFAFAGAVDQLRAARERSERAGSGAARRVRSRERVRRDPAVARADGASERRDRAAAARGRRGGRARRRRARAARRSRRAPGAELPGRRRAAKRWRSPRARCAGSSSIAAAARCAIERIDGEPALDSPLRRAFEAAGFRAEYKGLAMDRFAAERSTDRASP